MAPRSRCALYFIAQDLLSALYPPLSAEEWEKRLTASALVQSRRRISMPSMS